MMILGLLNTKSYRKLKEGFSLKVFRSYIKGRCDGLYCGRGVMQVQTISHWWLTIAINQILLNMSWEQLLIRHWRQKWLIQVSGLDVVLQKQYFCVCILRCGLLLNDMAGFEIFRGIDQNNKVTFPLVFVTFPLGVFTFWRRFQRFSATTALQLRKL